MKLKLIGVYIAVVISPAMQLEIVLLLQLLPRMTNANSETSEPLRSLFKDEGKDQNNPYINQQANVWTSPGPRDEDWDTGTPRVRLPQPITFFFIPTKKEMLTWIVFVTPSLGA